MARDVRREREEERRDWRRPGGREREDFGQADYSSDYRYNPEARAGYRAEEREREEDYGQADYSRDWAYDRQRGRPYRRNGDEDRERRDWEARREDAERRFAERHKGEHGEREANEPRSWAERAGGFFAGRDERENEQQRERDYQRRSRRRGPSDRVLWAVIVERLEEERGLDLRDVDVRVEEGEVTLNGTVRRKEEKRRIEDVADMEGVRNVQNNLRVRERSRWTFL